MKEFIGSSKQLEENTENDNNKKEKQHIYTVEEITSEVIDKFFTYLSLN